MHPGQCGQGALHRPGHLPAQFPMGACPPTGPGEPRVVARAWKAGAGPGDAPFTIDLDSTICETYGLAKEGARHHGYTGKRGYHPLLAVAAGTGDVLMSRLREGRANMPAAPPTSCERRWGGCATLGPGDNSRCGPTAASIPTPWSPSAAGWMSASPSLSASAKACTISSRRYPRRTGRRFLTGDGAADVAETTYTPFQSEPDATPVRLIVRRVKPTPGSQLALLPPTAITASSPTGMGRPWNWRPIIAATRDRERHPRPEVRRRAEPSPLGALRRQRRLAGRPGDGA